MKPFEVPGPRHEHLANIEHLLRGLAKRVDELIVEVENLRAADDADRSKSR